MGKRSVELNIISAQDLKINSVFGKARTYAVVWIHPSKKFYTHVDEEGGSNPAWNEKFVMSVDNSLLEQASGKFHIEIFHRGNTHDRVIGTVEVPFKEIPQEARFDRVNASQLQFMAFEIRKPSGRTRGILNLSIRLREVSTCSSSSSSSSDSEPSSPKRGIPGYPPSPATAGAYAPPVGAYAPPAGTYAPPAGTYAPPLGAYAPVPAGAYAPPAGAYAPSAGAYAPPAGAYASGYASGYPPAYGSNYYNPQPSYYNPPPARSGHSNMALGAGIAAGALGGLVLGEVVEDIADNAAEEAVENAEYGDDFGGDDY